MTKTLKFKTTENVKFARTFVADVELTHSTLKPKRDVAIMLIVRTQGTHNRVFAPRLRFVIAVAFSSVPILIKSSSVSHVFTSLSLAAPVGICGGCSFGCAGV